MSFQLKYSINIGYLDSKRKPITIYHLFLNERSPFYVLPSIFPHPSFINKLTPSMSYLLHLCSYYYILYILDISSNNITKQTFSSGELFKLFGERQQSIGGWRFSLFSLYCEVKFQNARGKLHLFKIQANQQNRGIICII